MERDVTPSASLWFQFIHNIFDDQNCENILNVIKIYLATILRWNLEYIWQLNFKFRFQYILHLISNYISNMFSMYSSLKMDWINFKYKHWIKQKQIEE